MTLAPYWRSECGGFVLYCGDCLQILPELGDGSIDAIVTSPPYNLNKTASGGGTNDTMRLKEKYEAEWYADEMPEAEYQEWQKKVLRECLRVCRGSVFYNHKPRYAWHSRNKFKVPANVYHPWDWLSEFPVWCEIIWDRGGVGSPNAGRYPVADERIFQLGKPKSWKPCGLSTVWRFQPDAENAEHPCPFPVALPLNCIEPNTSDGDLVLDPFCGSGTAGIACAQMGRRFIGIEIDEHYCAIAQKRIETALGVGGLFPPERKPAELFA